MDTSENWDVYEQFRESMRRLADDKIAPHAAEVDGEPARAGDRDAVYATSAGEVEIRRLVHDHARSSERRPRGNADLGDGVDETADALQRRRRNRFKSGRRVV